MKALFITLSILTSAAFFAQTTVSGGIYQNTTWTLAGSPYLMTGSIVVFPNRTLTIEPGVEVIVSADYTFNTGNFLYLELRGNLIANGTTNAPIVITSSDTSTGFYNWEGIRIKGSQGGSVQMNHFELHNSWYGIHNDIAETNATYTFDECLFRSNNYAIQLNTNLVYNNCIFESNGVGQAAQLVGGSLTATNCQFINNFCSITWCSNINVNNCTFTGNQNNIIGSSGLVENSQFINNVYGFAETAGVTINNCYFDGNGTGIEGTSACTITNNIFTNNNIAIKIGDAGNISQNQINGNATGIQVLAYDPNTTVIDNNSICNNSIHNLENLTDKNYQVNLNCFCSQDSTIIENGILDGYDDIIRGLVNYAIYDDSCENILTYVTKVNLGNPAGINELDNSWKAYYNGQSLVIENANQGRFTIYTAQGTQVMKSTVLQGENTIDVNLPNGLYLVRREGGSTEKVFIGN
ncbi:MAG: right-handed parallel beta-helix repeat-containing protein [Flavobacteriales bacterium]